jgi:hypothetical protein
VGQLVNRLNNLDGITNLKFIFNKTRYTPKLEDLKAALQKPDPDFTGKMFWERFNNDAFMSANKRDALFGGLPNEPKSYQQIEAFFITNFNTLF